MGYQDITLYKLIFEDRAGLEVTAEGLSTGDLLEVTGFAAEMPSAAAAAKGMSPAVRAQMESMFGLLARSLVEWNIEDRNGDPVPVTLDGIKSLKLALVMDILNAWVKAQTDVDDPLPQGSSPGRTGLEQSIPMTTAGSRGS